MTLDKAIEIFQLNLNTKSSKMPPDVKDSLQLGIEALKREKEHRELDIDTRFGLLPSETEE